jgi:hypothetical protein
MAERRVTVSHPVVWTVLYLPYGAMFGFVNVALTYLATKHGLSVTQAVYLNASSMSS